MKNPMRCPTKWLVIILTLVPVVLQGAEIPSLRLVPRPAKVHKLWSFRVNGVITDLSLSKNGKALLLATGPNPEEVGGARTYLLTRYTERGKKVWQKNWIGPVKSMDVSPDGSLTVIANHEEKVFALSSAGAKLWEAEVDCRPILLPGLRKILCYHDDDADPQVAFDVFDWNGKKLLSYSIPGDVLTLKVSRDGEFIVLALTHGKVSLISTRDFKPRWQRKLPGEIVDVSVSSGPNPSVAVICGSAPEPGKEARQKLALFDAEGNAASEKSLPGRVEQIELADTASALAYYGNGTGRGQFMGVLPLAAEAGGAGWKQASPQGAEYSSHLLLEEGGRMVVGYENTLSPDSGLSHVLGFNLTGGLQFDIPLATEEGAFLFADAPVAKAVGARLIVAGSDDGVLSAYWVR